MNPADLSLTRYARFAGLYGAVTHICRADGAFRFERAVERLQAEGYALLSKNRLEANAYAALKRPGGGLMHVWHTPCDGEVRITEAPNETPPAFAPAPCEGDGPSAFYAFENDHTLIDCGMCLLLQRPDHSFFVVDSGHYLQMNDNDRLYAFMRERTPAGRRVRIAGWLITHGHTDHVCKLMDFLRYNTGDVVIEGFYHNLLPPDYGEWDGNYEETQIARKLLKQLEAFPAPVFILHTGMRFYVRDLCFDVLSTHEDLHPEPIEDYNDSSAAVMVTAQGTRIFIPGDAAAAADRKLTARFDASLRCHVAQIAHHGHTGLSARCYEKLGADTVIFPVPRIQYEQDLPRHEANRRAAALAHHVFLTGDGTVSVPLPYDRKTVRQLPDETTEDFAKIERLWKYTYPPEYRHKIRQAFLEHGGDPDAIQLPVSEFGWIEPK